MGSVGPARKKPESIPEETSKKDLGDDADRLHLSLFSDTGDGDGPGK